MEIEHDPVSGRHTTGHEWDGIKELDTPVPWPARLALILTILFAMGYWVFYPAWPYLSDFSRGLIGYSSRDAVLQAVAEADDHRWEGEAELFDRDLEDLVADPAVRTRHEAAAAVLARDNCIMCHGRSLEGQPGFPNLTDGTWLWSGTVAEIEWTILYGINSDHDEERGGEMPAFGDMEMLEAEDIRAVSDYVLSLSAQDHDADLARLGAEVFEYDCSGCHGEDGAGGLETGAPDLTDGFWIYGGDRAAIQATVTHGRRGVMPAWEDRLSPAEIRKLALYVYWQSHE